MINGEKAIKALEVCSSGRCEVSCPYHNVPQCTRTIMADALALLKVEIAEKAPKWHIFHKRELTEAEKQEHPDWEWIMATDITPCDGDRILLWDRYDGIRTETWSDDLFAEYCETADGAPIEDGGAWMELPEPPYADMKGCEE